MTNTIIEGQIPQLTTGWRMRMALELAGISVNEIAEFFEVATGTINRWTHDRGPVKRTTLVLWAQRTGVDLNWLMNGSGGEGDGSPDLYPAVGRLPGLCRCCPGSHRQGHPYTEWVLAA